MGPKDQIIRKIKSKLEQVDAGVRSRAVATVEWECREMEHVFSLLVLGSLVGLPSPPLQITLELMPEMEQELLLMLSKIETARSPLSDLASILNVT